MRRRSHRYERDAGSGDLGLQPIRECVTTPKILDGNVTYAKIQNIAHGKVLGRLSAGAGVLEEAVIPFGQCRLAKSGSNLVLSPFKGNLITINSLAETIPDAGVTLSTGGLSPTTLYYIYAWMSSGTMTLEATTTAYATQTGTGVTSSRGTRPVRCWAWHAPMDRRPGLIARRNGSCGAILTTPAWRC